MNSIYEFITSKGILNQNHKEELKQKRGFTDETIAKYKFFSGGAYLSSAETELKEKFKLDELIASGVFIIQENTRQPVMSPMLLSDRVIIPYLNKERVTLLRPHKLGLKNVPIQIYETEWHKHMILAESEFKAVAAWQYGYPAIGIPGVGSHSDQYAENLVKAISSHGVKQVCIIFDSEVKDDPRFLNYKPNPASRYDTEYYAYYMAYLLEKDAGIDVRIGTLPATWRINGKIDLDGALASGRTKEEITRIISASLTYRQYLDEQTKEIQQIIRKKLDKKYTKSHIHTEFGCYRATRRRGKSEWDEEISNFTVSIVALHDTNEGIIREVRFTNKYGEMSRTFSLPAEQMGNDTFRTFCLSVGNYVWKGQPADLMCLWETHFLHAEETRFITEPDHIGWLEEEKMWLFGNWAIKEGKEMRPDESGIFWTERKGIKPVPLGITSGRNTISEGVPYISINDRCDIHEIRKNLTDTIGEVEALKCLGWVSAVPYIEPIFKVYGCFPFMFLTGKTGSGKSTIAEWLSCFLGIERSGITLSQTTAVGIQRSLGYYSCLPVFLDEYRNTQDIVYKTSFLRNVYNRQSSGKGIKSNNYALRMAKVRGTVIVAGEETPHDSALVNRSIIVEILKSKKVTDHYDWFTREKVKFSNYLMQLLKEPRLDDFIRILREAKEFFVRNKHIDERTAINYAVVTAGHARAFGDKDDKFAEMITGEILRVDSDSKGASILSSFLHDLAAMRFAGAIKERYWAVREGSLYLYFQGLYNLWAKDSRGRGVDVFKAASLLGYFKEEPGFVSYGVNMRIDGFQRKCIQLIYDQISDDIKELISEQENATA